MAQDYQLFFISHNKLAQGVLDALKMITGMGDDIEAFGLMPGQNPDDKVKAIEAKINPNAHVLILADLFGGSMANSAVRLTTKPNVKLITGLNLALALQTTLEKPWKEEEINKCIQQAQTNIKEVKLSQAKQSDSADDFF